VSTRSTKFRLDAPELDDAATIEGAVVPLRDRLEVVLNSLVPIGLPFFWPGAALPTIPMPAGEAFVAGTHPEFAWADGALIDRTVYAAFFAVVGHAYNGGVDPGGTPAKVRKPDKRGRAIVGADNFGVGAAGRLTTSAKILGASGGEELHQLTVAELAGHGHAQASEGYFGAGGGLSGSPNLTVGGGAYGQGLAGQTKNTTTSTGGDGAHNNMQPYEVDNVIVRIN
jgi:microcystin-dependent protein